MQRLLATCQMTRTQASVVCFTELHPEDFQARRVYRSHLQRWDFEGFGICIDRNWLQLRGARPVIYGDEDSWCRLPSSQRPFFQMAASKSGIQWTSEREWRHLGDVDLSGLSPVQADVFVPSAADAECISLYSRWPVTCAG